MLHKRLSLGLGILAGLSFRQVAAHGYCRNVTIGGRTYAGFDPTWAEGPSVLGPTPQRPADNVNTEWADYTTAQIATGSEKTSEVGTEQETAAAKAGDRVTIYYDQWPQPHSGPIMRYMALCPGDSCDGVPAGDLDWFKIGEEGFTNGQWPNDRLLPSNNWAQSFNLPTDLPGGNYLLANHMLAMHNVGQPQFYPVAFQIALESDGTVDPQPKGKFPDIYLNGPQDFVTWNIYENNNANMWLPGIPVYSGSGDRGQDGAGGGNTPPQTPPGNTSKGGAAPTSSKGGGRNTARPTETPVVPDEPRMSILPVIGNGPTVTTPPVMETDTPTVEPPVQADIGNRPAGGHKSGAAATSSVEDPLEFNGARTVTVTVYAPAPTAGAIESDADVEGAPEQGSVDGPIANSWRVKQGPEAQSQEGGTETEAEGLEGAEDWSDTAMVGNEPGTNPERPAATQSQGNTPASNVNPDCSHSSNIPGGESERDARRSRTRRQSGYGTHVRRLIL